MPRRPRNLVPGTVYHLISRFVDRDWFIKKDQERRDYLELLAKALTTSDWRCLAFAIMSNHIHLAALAGIHTLDSWIRRVHSPFADGMNRTYDRIGPMFVRGPKAISITPSGIGSVIAYIHNNPVRAEVVADPSASTWTSHRAYLGLEPAPAWLDVREGLARAGFDDPAAFHAWVIDPARERFAVAHDAEIEQDLTPPRREREHEVDLKAIVAITASELGISISQLVSHRRTSLEVTGRQVVVLCGQRLGKTGTDIALALDVSQQAISRISCGGVSTKTVAVAARVLQRLELGSSVSGHKLCNL